jgi:hypothetical protein
LLIRQKAEKDKCFFDEKPFVGGALFERLRGPCMVVQVPEVKLSAMGDPAGFREETVTIFNPMLNICVGDGHSPRPFENTILVGLVDLFLGFLAP